MKSIRLKYRFANRGYALARWSSGLALLPHQLAPEMAQLTLYDCCRLAGLSRPHRLRTQTGISDKAVRHIAERQDKLMRGNPYHNKAHIGQVIISAGLLADAAEIGQNERNILILAALIHDYAHLGARRNKSPYWQESLSLELALPKLQRYGIDVRLLSVLKQMVLATSPAADFSDDAYQGDDILSLLLDADLFGSLFLPKAQVDRLTAQLKYEDRLTISVSDLRDRFITHCRIKGFASIAGQRLHEAITTHQTYSKG